MKKAFLTSFALALFACVPTSLGVISGPSYQVTPLGFMAGSNSTQALDVNNAGQVTGIAYLTPGGYRAFRWTSGSFTNLGTLGSNFSAGHGISDSGVVVGDSNNSNSQPNAFRWQGSMTNLGSITGPYSTAYGINEVGQIVGSASAPGPTAALWQNGNVTNLGTLGGISRAFAINEAGLVVGESELPSGAMRAFRWSGGTMTNLGTLPGGQSSHARAVNDAGQIAGDSDNGSFQRGFLYNGGPLIALNPVSGDNTSGAAGLNSSGWAVGVSHNFGFEGRAALWLAGSTVALDLNTMLPSGSGWQLLSAQDINDAGQIIGLGRLNGNYEAFLLTPIPEPAMLAPVLGFACMLRRRRQRNG